MIEQSSNQALARPLGTSSSQLLDLRKGLISMLLSSSITTILWPKLNFQVLACVSSTHI